MVVRSVTESVSQRIMVAGEGRVMLRADGRSSAGGAIIYKVSVRVRRTVSMMVSGAGGETESRGIIQ